MMKKKSKINPRGNARTPDQRCILCQNEILAKVKPEHILLNSLGGRMTVRDVICSECNHQMGIGPDEDLAKSTEFLRNICQLKAGDGDDAPQIRGLEFDGLRFDLTNRAKPRVRAQKPLGLSATDKEIQVAIEAYSEEEAEKLATGAAEWIAKRLGRATPEAVNAIKQDILKDMRSGFRPGPEIRQAVQFGTGKSQQSKAKACLALWARFHGNAEVNSSRYDVIRHFIRSGERPEVSDGFIELDTRPLPKLPDRFGTNPNVVWVGSNTLGKAFGYFRLYGAIGWRIPLCDRGAPLNQRHCLVSNPFDNKEWAVLRDNQCPVDTDWIFAHLDVEQHDFEQVQNRLTPMLAFAHKLSKRSWLDALVQEGLQKHGCKEGETITEKHIKGLVDHIGPALTAYLLKKSVHSSRS